MSILERHQSALYDPSLTPFFTSEKKQKVFLEDTSEYLSQISADLCQSIPIMMTFVDFTKLKLFLFAFYTKAFEGQCDQEFLQEDYHLEEEELYEDPVFLSFHFSQLLIVIVIFTFFAAIIFFAKRKSKKRVLKLRSETCSALNKLGSVSFDKELTKTKQSKKVETISEEV